MEALACDWFPQTGCISSGVAEKLDMGLGSELLIKLLQPSYIDFSPFITQMPRREYLR
jgi:hypothetical protein